MLPPKRHVFNALPHKANNRFSKLANKDTLPVYNIPFESHWSAYSRTDIWAATKEVDILREIAWKCKNELLKKMYQPSSIVGILLNYS